jgi:hypothetical protein
MYSHKLLRSHLTMTFLSVCSTTHTYSSASHRNLPLFNGNYFTLQYFMISTNRSLHLMYHFPNNFPKISWFTGKSP